MGRKKGIYHTYRKQLEGIGEAVDLNIDTEVLYLMKIVDRLEEAPDDMIDLPEKLRAMRQVLKDIITVKQNQVKIDRSNFLDPEKIYRFLSNVIAIIKEEVKDPMIVSRIAQRIHQLDLGNNPIAIDVTTSQKELSQGSIR